MNHYATSSSFAGSSNCNILSQLTSNENLLKEINHFFCSASNWEPPPPICLLSCMQSWQCRLCFGQYFVVVWVPYLWLSKHWAFIWIQLTGCDGPQDASCADLTSVYRISGCSYLQCANNMCTSTFSVRCESFDSLKYKALRCYCRSIYMALLWAFSTSCHTILAIGSDQELPHYDSNSKSQRLSFKLRCKSLKGSKWSFCFSYNDHIGPLNCVQFWT